MTNVRRKLSLRAADGVILPQREVSPFSLKGIGRGLSSAYEAAVDATSRGMEIVAKPFTPPPGYTPAIQEQQPVEPATAPQPVAPATTGLPQLGGMNLDAIRRREAAAGLRDGAVKLRGPGGPVDDKIDAELSSGETVLPADTTEALGAENLRRAIDLTHTPAHLQKKGVPPGGVLRNGFANGIVGIDVDERPMTRADARAFNLPEAGGVKVTERPMTPGDARTFNLPEPGGVKVTERPMTPSDARAFGMQPGTNGVPPESRAYRAGRAAMNVGGKVASGLRSVGPAAAGAEVIGSFGENRISPDMDPVDSSAAGTLRYLRQGDFDNVGASLRKGAVEAGMDVATGLAKVGDVFLPGQPLQTGLRNRFQSDLGSGLEPTDVTSRPVATAAPAVTNPTDARLAAGTQTTPVGGPVTSTVPGSGGVQRRGNSFSNTGEFLEPGGPISAQNSAAADALVARSTAEARAGLRRGMEENLPAGYGVTNARSTQMEDLAARNASVRSTLADAGLSNRQRLQRDSQEAQVAAQRDIAAQRDATERRGQDITDAGFARRDRVSLRGQDLDFQAKVRGQDSTARTAAARARQEQMNSDRQFQLDVAKHGHERARANFDQRQKAQDSVREQITSMIPHGEDGKPDTVTGARYATALNAALSNYQSALERRAAAGDARAAQELQRVEEQGMAALDAKDIRAFVNGMKAKDLAEQNHTGSFNPIGGTAVISDEPVTSMRKTSDGFLGFGGEYTTNRGDTIPARVVEGDGSFFGGRRRVDLRDMVR